MAEGGEGHDPNIKKTIDPELEQDLRKIEKESNEMAERIHENVSQELSSHLAKLEEEFRAAFDDRVKQVTSQCKAQASDEMTKKQTDILRTNKVFREISRPLGDKWKPVFEILIADLDPERKRIELEKVEHERPLMRSYKALMTWKEVRAEDFDVRELLNALRIVGLDDLAEKTLNILDSEKDALLSFSYDGTKPSKLPTGATGTGKAASSGDGLGQNFGNFNAEEILDDRHLLQVAKKLGGEWEPLARGLNVTPGEVAEIIEGEGRTYQGAFKMLWNWRESKSNLTEALSSLIAQLKANNQQEIVELLH